jgi:hypothetical protein
MADILKDLATYESMRAELEADSMGRWVLIHDRILIGRFDSLQEAAEEAVRKFGRGPYLIRQVGAAPITLPASVMFNLA